MAYSRNTVRQVITLALAWISLLNIAAGPTLAGRRPAPNHFNPSDATTGIAEPDQKTKARIRKAFGKLPMRFEANAGQTDPQVKYLFRGSSYSLFLTPTEAVMRLEAGRNKLRNDKAQMSNIAVTPNPQPQNQNQQSVLRMKFVGADSAPELQGVEPFSGKSNYFLGNDPGKWRRNVTSYAKVCYKNLYPGIDVVYYGNQEQLEYDFIVTPGADPNNIKLRFEGAKRMKVDANGDLVLQTANGQLRQHKPVIYQDVKGRRKQIAGHYVLKGEQEVAFEVAAYDRTRPLVIDPVVVYSTFLGGAFRDVVEAIAVDEEGSVYVTGTTGSPDFPTLNPIQPQLNPQLNPMVNSFDAFVTKLNPEGSALIYSTFLGGKLDDSGYSITVGKDGTAYLAGYTFSEDFPTKNPLQPSLANDGSTSGVFSPDAFVTRLSADGTQLLYSTFLGGTRGDFGTEVRIDREKNIYVAGVTFSDNFPIENPLQSGLIGRGDFFVAKLTADGSRLRFSTYLGGTNDDIPSNFGPFMTAARMELDKQGNIFLTGATSSTDFPTAHPLQPALAGGADLFVTKISSQGNTLLYSTYLGGSAYDRSYDLAVDSSGNAYVTGETESSNYPTMAPLQAALAGIGNVFISKINPSGSALVYSTYIGGSYYDNAVGIAVNAAGEVYLTGATLSENFPTINAIAPLMDQFRDPLVDPTYHEHAFITKLNAEGSCLIYSSYLSGRGDQQGTSITVDGRGNVYLAGSTGSADFRTTPGAFKRIKKEPEQITIPFEVFILKISDRSQGRSNGLEAEDEETGSDEKEQ